jgi:hypothetical protein
VDYVSVFCHLAQSLSNFGVAYTADKKTLSFGDIPLKDARPKAIDTSMINKKLCHPLSIEAPAPCSSFMMQLNDLDHCRSGKAPPNRIVMVANCR